MTIFFTLLHYIITIEGQNRLDLAHLYTAWCWVSIYNLFRIEKLKLNHEPLLIPVVVVIVNS